MSCTSTTVSVFGTLREVGTAVGAWCDGFDASLETGSGAAAIVDDLAGVVRRLQAAQTEAAVRAVECGIWRSTRSRDGASWLAHTLGCSLGEAHRMLRTGERLGSCPDAHAAFVAGSLSVAEADAVTSASVLDPSSERRLVARAVESHDLARTRRQAEQVRTAARTDEDEATRYRRLRARRRWIESRDDGMVAIDARLVPEDWAPVKAMLDRFQQTAFERARATGDHAGPAAHRADGVLAAVTLADDTPVASTSDASAPKPSTRRANVVVLVDAIALKRGRAAPGETCEVPGVGPVSVPFARALMDEALVDVLVHDGVDITTYASATRHVPRPVRLAIDARDGRCLVPDCEGSPRYERDHRVPYAERRRTDYQTLGGFCGLHHDQKTHQGARLERHGDEWWWYPPPQPGRPPPEPVIGPVGHHLGRWNLDHPPASVDAPPRTEPLGERPQLFAEPP